MSDYLRYYVGPLAVLIGIVGFYLGGQWVWLGFSTYFIGAGLDLFLPRDVAERYISRPILADLPLYAHAFLLPLLYVTFTWRAVTDGGAGAWSGLQIGGLIATLAWLSAVPNLPIQHELMHRRDRFSQFCSFLLGTLYGDPLRVIAHTHSHHIHLGTPADADTARRGETMYTFPWRVTWACYAESVKVERARWDNAGRSFWNSENMCLRGLAAVVLVFAVIGVLAGPGAVVVAFVGMLFAKLLVEAFNYYQHYGIVRVPGTQYDRRHLWNHLQPVARAMAVEITNHSDHHMDSYRPFYRLKPDPEGPQMPSIFFCFLLGLVPPLWFRLVAQPRLKDWDQRFATEGERALARAANAKAGWPNWIPD